jgi:hypothetical protein
VRRVELSTDALPYWRPNRDKPRLVIISNEPFLQPIPDELRDRAVKLALSGSPQALKLETRYFTPAPTLIPPQALSAALAAGLCEQITWIIPTTVAVKDFDLDALLSQLKDSGILTDVEAEESERKERFISMPFRGKRLEITTLADLDETVTKIDADIIHIDLSFFQVSYSNEVKTPLYPLVSDTLKTLTTKLREPAVVTISASTEEEGMVGMSFRTLGPAIETALTGTTAEKQRAAKLRAVRGKVLYLETFMANDEALKELQQATKSLLDEPALLYDLYRAQRVAKQGALALQSLAAAVAIDPGYAYEYLTLARDAKRSGRPDKGIEMLTLAKQYFPRNHYIELERAQLWYDTGQAAKAAEIYRKLLKQPWSTTYYPDMPLRIEALLRQAEGESSKPEAGGN